MLCGSWCSALFPLACGALNVTELLQSEQNHTLFTPQTESRLSCRLSHSSLFKCHRVFLETSSASRHRKHRQVCSSINFKETKDEFKVNLQRASLQQAAALKSPLKVTLFPHAPHRRLWAEWMDDLYLHCAQYSRAISEMQTHWNRKCCQSNGPTSCERNGSLT